MNGVPEQCRHCQVPLEIKRIGSRVLTNEADVQAVRAEFRQIRDEIRESIRSLSGEVVRSISILAELSQKVDTLSDRLPAPKPAKKRSRRK